MGTAAHALTIDVEEWFHICGVGGALAASNWPALPSRVVPTTTALLELLDRCGIRATFFVLGYVAERHPDLIRQIRRANHEIGSHGHQHDRVYELTPSQFEQDLDRSRAALASCGVTDIAGFRAPEWSINDRSLWALDVLVSRGIGIDSSMAPLRIVGNPRYPQEVHRRATAHGEIVECPPAVHRRLGQNVPQGGSWGLRMSRPAAVLRALEARLAAGRPAVLWIHPWEIDADPPHIALPAASRFAHYFCLSGFQRRLETILRGAAFGPLSELVRASPS
ncbi:MAG TPA: polysaccharide deacetylase family protein [Vicinamibacterales bacterium]|nr:polysaccharide deacetylase family protein [Vicinamibacterales bacterium]